MEDQEVAQNDPAKVAAPKKNPAVKQDSPKSNNPKMR